MVSRRLRFGGKRRNNPVRIVTIGFKVRQEFAAKEKAKKAVKPAAKSKKVA